MNDIAPRAEITEGTLADDHAQIVPAELLAQLKPMLDGPTSDEATAFATWALQKIRRVPSDDCDESQIDCLLRIAQYFFLASLPTKALEAATYALTCARGLKQTIPLRQALTFAGAMRNECGDLPGAIDAYGESMQISRELQAEEQEAPVWYNLGTALATSTQYSDALKCFKRAASVATNCLEQRHVEHNALGAVAICALYLGEMRIGIEAAIRAIELNSCPERASECFSRVIAESHYARLLLEVGNIVEAQERAELVHFFAFKVPTSRAQYVDSLTEGLVAVHSNRVDAGLALLQHALEHVRSSVPSEVADALSVCIVAHETAGQPDVALIYLHELLAFNRETKAEQLQMQQQLLTAGISLSGQAADEAALISDAARLQSQVDARLQHLTNTAINAGLAAGHDLYRVFRVSRLSELFAQSEGWSADKVRQVALAAKLADIGMIAAPEPLLTKTRSLSAAERKLMDDHTRFGAELLSGAKLALLQPCIPVARFHHEKWDGSGAWSLASEAIPPEARLVALCDAFDAMTHPRPWRPQPLSTAAALREIGDQAGRQFDPELAARFIDFVQREFWKHDDFSAFLGEEALGNGYVRARLQITRMMAGDDEARR